MITPIEIQPSAGPGLVKVCRVTAGQSKSIQLRLTDPHGKPTSNAGPFRLRVMNGELGQNAVLFDLQLTTGANGLVTAALTPEHTACVGIYDAMIAAGGGEAVNETWQVLFAVEPSAFQAYQGGGPLTIPEVRLTLLDSFNLDEGPFSNLLDGVEFSDVEIVHAIRRVVDMWNETPPNIAYYSTADFPYRYWWSVAVTAMLLRMAAARYRRNRLAYSAGGVSIDDQSKAQEYEEISELRMREFKEWMTREKSRINSELCWATGL